MFTIHNIPEDVQLVNSVKDLLIRNAEQCAEKSVTIDYKVLKCNGVEVIKPLITIKIEGVNIEETNI